MAAEDPYNEKRAKFLTESLEHSNEPRWGYFGFPGPLAIGDNSFAPKTMKKAPPPEDAGEPIRNMLTAPVKKGAGTDVYFKFETPLALGDPYVDPGFLMKKGKVTMLDPEAAFRPPGKVKASTNKLGYEYVEHKDAYKDPKATMEKYKDFMPPRNIYSNPQKKGGPGVWQEGVMFGFDERRRFPEHVPDDYDSARKQRLKDLEEHKQKVQEQPFRGIDYGNKNFHSNTDVYNYNVPTHIPRVPKESTTKKHTTEPFRPSNPPKKGANEAAWGGIPEYIPDPCFGGAKRKPPLPEGQEAPPAFRNGGANKVSHPTPSVTTLTRNMRNERPSSFVRPSL